MPNLESLNFKELVKYVYPKPFEIFWEEAIDAMGDREWCEKHKLDYFTVTFKEVEYALYRDYWRIAANCSTY